MNPKTFFVAGYVFQGLGNMVFLTGFLFRLMSWPAANFNLIAGVVLYIIGFLLFRYGRSIFSDEQLENSQKYQPLKGLRIASNVLVGGGILLFLGGMMFKLQSWPGASWILLLAYLIAILGIIVIYLNKILRVLGIGSKRNLDTLDEGSF